MNSFPGFHAGRSGDIAKRRLKLVLVSDKAGCSPETILMIKDDIIRVISRYMEVDKDKVQIQLAGREEGQSQGNPALYASIPIRSIPNKGLC